ncbi:MAG: nucleoside deaminase [Candidatus Tectomicrobia bacterium]|uniref:tRNA-specific adenosine deaminase n=1 Tax=Tectimicrobiota bacterium TaxID=2528274 RepID=A0A933LPF8_UNCTE|nr:nucleoside deaminase [Candidatus Tectomicrobia bacterium]
MEERNIHHRFMLLALELAEKASSEGEVPVGAVVVRQGSIIGRGYNKRETDFDPTAHAEVVALREAALREKSWRLEGAWLYVTVEPCIMCAGAIINARIEKLIFGCYDLKAGACGSIFKLPTDNRLNHKVEIISGVLENDARELMQAFFRDRRIKERWPSG